VTQDVIERIADRIQGVSRSGRELRGLCPAHDDHTSSLMFRAADRDGESGGVLVWCGAGCKPADIMAAIGMTMADLMGEPHVTATYTYMDRNNQPVYTVERWSNKDFRVRPGLPPPADRVIYNLPWVLYARSVGKPIYVVEGEKDVETLRAHGLVGTCNPGGAGRGKWLGHYSGYLRGADVIVMADNDAPGEDHARHVFKSLSGIARSVHLCKPGYGKDVTDLLNAGYSIDHVQPVLERASLGLLHAAKVLPKKPRWAWQGYVPWGTYTLIDGDPGDGKSTLTCDLVARWSTGAPMPDGSANGGPFNVVMISAEDDPDSTVVPRLMNAGADLERIHFVMSGLTEDAPYQLTPEVLASTEDVIQEHKVRILVIDPLMAFMPDKVNGYIDAEVRRSMSPLGQLARRQDVALVVVRHLTKSATKALYAGSGSIGIIGAARSALMVRQHPNDPEVRVLVSTKSNLARKPASLGYRLETNPVNETAAVRWVGVVELSADELFARETQLTLEQRDEEGEAATWLRGYLMSVSGSAEVAAIRTAAVKAGIGFEALRKAKRRMGVQSSGKAGPGGSWSWTLPSGTEKWEPSLLGSHLSHYHYSETQRSDDLGSEPPDPPSHRKPIDDLSHYSEDNPAGQGGVEGNSGKGGKGGNTVGLSTSSDSDVPTTDAAMLGRIVGMPLLCEVCGATPESGRKVYRFTHPHYVVRCSAHDPETYLFDDGHPDG
jgi:hypothetical protein